MATAFNMILASSALAAFNVSEVTNVSTPKASARLQTNHEVNDIIFNSAGLHSHIIHHLLAAYALGADAQTVQKHYDNNESYQ